MIPSSDAALHPEAALGAPLAQLAIGGTSKTSDPPAERLQPSSQSQPQPRRQPVPPFWKA
jgi:hypothetical protein